MMKPMKTFVLGLMIGLMLLLCPQSALALGLDEDSDPEDWPDQLTNVQVMVTADNKIRATWDHSDAYYVTLEVWMDGDKQDLDKFFYVYCNGWTSPDYIDISVPLGHTYLCGVSATNSDGWGPVRIYKIVNLSPPGTPALLKIKDVKWYGTATLTWDDINMDETAWIIEQSGYDEEGMSYYRKIELAPHESVGKMETIVTTLESEGSYTFTVYAMKGGMAGPKEAVTVFVPMMPLSELTAQHTNTNPANPPLVLLKWKRNSYHRIDAVQIQRTNPDGTTTMFTNPYYNDPWYDEQVEADKNYTYRIRAINKSEPGYASPWSDPASTLDLHVNPVPVESKVKPIQVMVNGSRLTMDVVPMIEQGRTLVPMRSIFEAVGASVLWNDQGQSITATRGDITILLKIGSNQAFINGKAVILDVAPRIYNGRTLVPLRFVSESLGDAVNWDDKSQTASIVSSFKKPLPVSAKIKPSIPDLQPIKISYSLSLEPSQITLNKTDYVEFTGVLKTSTLTNFQTGLGGKAINLYKITDGNQRTLIGTAQTDSNGDFSYKYKPYGSCIVKAVYQNATGEDLAVSSNSTVTVKSATIISKLPTTPILR